MILNPLMTDNDEYVAEQDLESSISIKKFTPRRSGRYYQLNRWNKRTVGFISSIDFILRRERFDRDIIITRCQPQNFLEVYPWKPRLSHYTQFFE